MESEIKIASGRVGAIVEAAERAAEELRAQTEQRARDRIAEADRAADLRVDAAETEAHELVEAAKAEVRELVEAAKAEVAGIHQRAAADRADAQTEAARTLAQAEEQARTIRNDAKAQAREILHDAHTTTRGVMDEGLQVTDDLRELGQSLMRNADRLLRDVKHTHARLTAEVDQATPADEPFVRDARLPTRAAGVAPPEAAPAPSRQASTWEAPVSPAPPVPEGAPRRRRGQSTPLPIGDAFDVPEFVSPPRTRRT